MNNSPKSSRLDISIINKRWLCCNLDIQEEFPSTRLRRNQGSSFRRFFRVCWVQCTSPCSPHRCICSHSSWLFCLLFVCYQMRVCVGLLEVTAVAADYLLDCWSSPACPFCHLCWSKHHHISRIRREYWHIPGSWSRSDWMTCCWRGWCRWRRQTCSPSYIVHRASHRNCRSMSRHRWQPKLGKWSHFSCWLVF